GEVPVSLAALDGSSTLVAAGSGTGELRFYDGVTGVYRGASQPPMASLIGLAIGPNGNLYATKPKGAPGGRVNRFDPITHAFIDEFVSGLNIARAVTFGPDGNLYVANDRNQILRFDGTTGTFMDVFVSDSELLDQRKLIFRPDGYLYVLGETGT